MTEAYLFVHFTGTEDDASHEQIYFSVSKDGREWSILNGGKAVLESSVGEGGVRDPYIVRSPVNGKFYLMATDLSIYNRKQSGVDEKTAWEQCRRTGSRNILVWESNDLVYWSDPRLAFAAPECAGCCWAPKCVWDSRRKMFMLMFASTMPDDGYKLMRLYRCFTSDFVSFTEPELCIDRSADGIGVFDAAVIEDNGRFFRIYKTDRIMIDAADSLDGKWDSIESNIHSLASAHEGPAVCRLNGRKGHLLMLDSLETHGGYEAFVTEDISAGQFECARIVLPENIKYRHGSLMPITNSEYSSIVKGFGAE